MRYLLRLFKFVAWTGTSTVLIASTIVLAQQPTISTGISPDFASSARARVNHYREIAKLPLIVEDNAISLGAYNHARYLVKNRVAGGDIILDHRQLRFQIPQETYRSEGQGNPYFTDEGASAARSALVLRGSEISLSGAEFVDQVMTMPFSGLVPMVPQFSIVGLGAYCDPGDCAVVILYRYALEKSIRLAFYDGPASDRLWNPSLGLIPYEQGRLRTPVEFPPDKAVVDLQTYRGGDYPDPLTSCPGFKAPTGTPISIQLGEGYGPEGSLEVSDHSISHDGVQIENCLITAASYFGPNAQMTRVGKQALERFGAAIILPRQPLESGSYKVAITEAAERYEWSFTVKSSSGSMQSKPVQ